MGAKHAKLNKILFSLLAAVALYLLVTLIITLVGVFGMVVQNQTARDIQTGKEAYQNAMENQKAIQVYSASEIQNDPGLKNVRLFCLAPQTNEKTDFVLILPGGGFVECDIFKVAMPCAAQVTEKGHRAFVLEYRVGHQKEKYAGLKDVVRALQYIFEHSQELNVTTNYAVAGFSAGGNLAGLLATKSGYQAHSLPKPQALLLAYPWVDVNADTKISGNIWQDLVFWGGKVVANSVVVGAFPTQEEKLSLCVTIQMDKDFPPCYVVVGNSDVVLNYKDNSVALCSRLDELGIPFRLNTVDGLNHGFGVGKGTAAENWVDAALEFWQEQL